MIKFCTNLKQFRQLLIAALPVLLVGCQQSMHGNSSNYPAACAGNAYLTKYDCSIERIQRAAEEGSADAQYALGYMYYYGISTMRDQETATLWIKRAADQGQPLAKRALTLMQNGGQIHTLHQRRSGGGSSMYQPKADVEAMNASTPEQPITHALPNYKPGSTKKAPVLDVLKKHPDEAKNTKITSIKTAHKKLKNRSVDPRLLKSAKPVVAHRAQKLHKLVATHRVHKTEKGGYTLQLMGSHHLSALKSYAKAQGLTRKVHFYKAELNHKPWYLLTYGDYKTAKQAETALRQLSAQIKKNHPWVKSMHALRKEIRQQKVVG